MSTEGELWHIVEAKRDDGTPTMFRIRELAPLTHLTRIFVVELPYSTTEMSRLPNAAAYRRAADLEEQWIRPACQTLGWEIVGSKTEDGSFFLYMYGGTDPQLLIEKLSPFDAGLGFYDDEDPEWKEYGILRALLDQAKAIPPSIAPAAALPEDKPAANEPPANNLVGEPPANNAVGEPPATQGAGTSGAKKAAAKKTAAKPPASKAASKKPASKQASSKNAASKKPAAKKAVSKKAVSKKPAAKKAAAKKPAAKKAASNKPAAQKAAANKAASKKPATKKAVQRSAPAKRKGK